MSASPAPLAPCYCTFNADGSARYQCDIHRPPPPPDPPGACVLCHFVGDESDLVIDKDGINFHKECTR